MRDADQDTDTPSRHYITIFCSGTATDETQEAQLLEPQKCLGWQWVPWKWLYETAKAQSATMSPRTAQPTSDEKLMLAQGVGEKILNSGRQGSQQTHEPRSPPSPAQSFSSLATGASSDSISSPRRAAQQLKPEDMKAWHEADEFAGDSFLFQPLVNFFLQLPQPGKHGLP